ATRADLRALLDLHEGPDPGVVPDLAAVEVHEAVNPDPGPELHIRRDPHSAVRFRAHTPLSSRALARAADSRGIGRTPEKGTGPPCVRSDSEHASKMRTISRPRSPQLSGRPPSRMHSTKCAHMFLSGSLCSILGR